MLTKKQLVINSYQKLSTFSYRAPVNALRDPLNGYQLTSPKGLNKISEFYAPNHPFLSYFSGYYLVRDRRRYFPLGGL
jgi:hypothetical protein